MQAVQDEEAFRAETEAYLHDRIPVTRTMGVKVESCADGRIVISAPLEINHNHLGTAFGGSLASVAVLAGYAMLWTRVSKHDCHLVIRDSRIRYHHPVTGDIRAVCEIPGEETLAIFMDRLTEKRKARVWLRVSIVEDGRTCVDFEGEYVAIS